MNILLKIFAIYSPCYPLYMILILNNNCKWVFVIRNRSPRAYSRNRTIATKTRLLFEVFNAERYFYANRFSLAQT